jgi:ribosomal protein S18 acetylase RimI-like enzyme
MKDKVITSQEKIMSKVTKELQIELVTEATQAIAKDLILEGLAERFGFIDYSLNPDLNNIVESYINKGNVFLTGTIQGDIRCTGALINEETTVGRIVRMSVLKEYRRTGFARKMLEKLEGIARDKGYTRLVLETNVEWVSAVQFYKSCGFNEINIEDGLVHMVKQLNVNYTPQGCDYGVVLAVSCSESHTFSKRNHEVIQLLAGLGVKGEVTKGDSFLSAFLLSVAIP